MVKRSKLLVALLLLALALMCLAGCGGAVEPSAEDGPAATGSPEATSSPAVTDGPPAAGGEAEVSRLGLLTPSNISAEDLDAMSAAGTAQHGIEAPPVEHVYFDTLSSMLLALQAGQIDMLSVPTAVAEYIVAGNDALIIEYVPPTQDALSMAVLEENAELLARLNDAIAALQADGTVEALAATHIVGASPGAEVTPEAIPVIEGAETIKVAITGDMPPIDYVSADGKPAGFNVALLSAISQQAGVNIELVSIDAGARVLALTSGRADAVFWVRSVVRPDGTADATSDAPPGVALTDSYYTDTVSFVSMK